MEISGYGDDTLHTENAALLIDLGGDDVYTNNAGGCGRNGGVAVCIDHAGNDKYLAPDSSYVQGFGFLGVGMLVDLAGNDVYKAKHFSQGVGIMGVGVLWDKAGNDTFSANASARAREPSGSARYSMMQATTYTTARPWARARRQRSDGRLVGLEGNDQYR